LEAATPRPPKIERSSMWPAGGFHSQLFRREKIAAGKPNSYNALWIARAFALPNDWHLAEQTLVWASGQETWKRLADRGVWVNGCAESLGEQESPGIETLAGEPLRWLKLTHDRGYTEGEMPSLGTYTLVSKRENPDLSGKRYFFWRSGSSFEQALALNPWLKEMTHFCGVGNTQRILERNGVRPHVFLDQQQWSTEMHL